MLRQTLTLQGAITFLNELMAIDEAAVMALIKQRVPCNQGMAEHPTVQAGAGEGVYDVGFLGILNGLFGTIEGGARDGWGPIALVYGPNERARFELTEALLIEGEATEDVGGTP